MHKKFRNEIPGHSVFFCWNTSGLVNVTFEKGVSVVEVKKFNASLLDQWIEVGQQELFFSKKLFSAAFKTFLIYLALHRLGSIAKKGLFYRNA